MIVSPVGDALGIALGSSEYALGIGVRRCAPVGDALGIGVRVDVAVVSDGTMSFVGSRRADGRWLESSLSLKT